MVETLELPEIKAIIEDVKANPLKKSSEEKEILIRFLKSCVIQSGHTHSFRK